MPDQTHVVTIRTTDGHGSEVIDAINFLLNDLELTGKVDGFRWLIDVNPDYNPVTRR